jgi:hypothetical protein
MARPKSGRAAPRSAVMVWTPEQTGAFLDHASNDDPDDAWHVTTLRLSICATLLVGRFKGIQAASRS